MKKNEGSFYIFRRIDPFLGEIWTSQVVHLFFHSSSSLALQDQNLVRALNLDYSFHSVFSVRDFVV